MPWSSASGVSLHFRCSGDGPRNIVFIHELGGSLDGWESVASLLESDFRVLRYDQRGAGLSEKVRTPFTIVDLVRDLESLIRAAELEPPYNIAGLAAGAGVALLFAHRHASEMGALILACPAIGVDANRRRYLAERSELAAREGMRAVVDSTLSRSYPDVVIRDRAIYDSYRARFLANDPVSYGLANRALAETKIDSIVEGVDTKCLVLAGMHDSLRPPDEIKALADRLPNAQFAEIDSAHLMHVQAPRALAESMQAFLSKSRENNRAPESRNVSTRTSKAAFAGDLPLSSRDVSADNAGVSLRLKANGIDFNCRVDGRSNAPWLVFSNSLATNLSMWEKQVAAFANSFRILRYDQRGHGSTDVPVCPVTFDILAEDAAALLEAFGIKRATFVGVSMGAVTALLLAARFPDRLVRVVASDGQWVTPPGSAEIWEERIRLVLKEGMGPLVEQTVNRWFQPDFLGANSLLLQEMREMIRATPSEGYIASIRALQKYDFREVFPTISVPTLLIVGEKDGMLPGAMKEMKQSIPGSALIEITGAGHLPNVEKPEAFNRGIEPFILGAAPQKLAVG
jgi:3-oxoadipate enol-lactonase